MKIHKNYKNIFISWESKLPAQRGEILGSLNHKLHCAHKCQGSMCETPLIKKRCVEEG